MKNFKNALALFTLIALLMTSCSPESEELDIDATNFETQIQQDQTDGDYYIDQFNETSKSSRGVSISKGGFCDLFVLSNFHDGGQFRSRVDLRWTATDNVGGLPGLIDYTIEFQAIDGFGGFGEVFTFELIELNLVSELSLIIPTFDINNPDGDLNGHVGGRWRVRQDDSCDFGPWTDHYSGL